MPYREADRLCIDRWLGADIDEIDVRKFDTDGYEALGIHSLTVFYYEET